MNSIGKTGAIESRTHAEAAIARFVRCFDPAGSRKKAVRRKTTVTTPRIGNHGRRWITSICQGTARAPKLRNSASCSAYLPTGRLATPKARPSLTRPKIPTVTIRMPASTSNGRDLAFRTQASSSTSPPAIAAVSFDATAAIPTPTNRSRVVTDGWSPYRLAIRMHVRTKVVASRSNTPDNRTTASGASGAVNTSRPARTLHRWSCTHPAMTRVARYAFVPCNNRFRR